MARVLNGNQEEFFGQVFQMFSIMKRT